MMMNSKTLIEKDIHDISIQQNGLKKNYNHESIQIKYMLCNASTTCYVSKITKTLEFMKNETKTQHIQIMIWIPS